MNENKENFAIGEFVWLTKDIFDDGGDCHPAGYVGRRGDYMRITGLPDYNPKMIHVVHFDYKGEGGICAYPHEISKSTPLITILERREYVKKYGLKRSGLTEKDLRQI
ncbi:hypothetical protein [Acinetobacter sp. ANC 3813]|uniref:hypothetical protein n=1 Tax=Acinetobacter sp. ANC 3813 TaxID=1977873 RepID=UPI00111BCE9D|nr:hypothetical protein [Acinetobacter sp. ANC 3813]